MVSQKLAKAAYMCILVCNYTVGSGLTEKHKG